MPASEAPKSETPTNAKPKIPSRLVPSEGRLIAAAGWGNRAWAVRTDSGEPKAEFWVQIPTVSEFSDNLEMPLALIRGQVEKLVEALGERMVARTAFPQDEVDLRERDAKVANLARVPGRMLSAAAKSALADLDAMNLGLLRARLVSMAAMEVA